MGTTAALKSSSAGKLQEAQNPVRAATQNKTYILLNSF
jgi:hypothetical protein